MKYISRQEIDDQQWNRRIAQHPERNIFQYTWYLDAVAENWGALVTTDYKTVLPLPYTVKLGIKSMYQAPFTRHYTIVGNDFNWEEALKHIRRIFKRINFRSLEKIGDLPYQSRKYQFSTINAEYRSAFSSNARRMVNKSEKNFTIQESTETKALLDLFDETVGKKLKSIDTTANLALEKLFEKALKLDQGKLFCIKDSDQQIIAAAFFLFDNDHITYLKGAASQEAKKLGAMYGLINHVFLSYQNYTILDFGGSNIESIADFFKKFGAQDNEYYDYSFDQSPFWFKALKKLKP